MIALDTGFFDLKVNADLSISIPAELLEKGLQDRMAKVLVPPPTAKSDEVLAASGGMFYAREAPGMEPFVQEGAHFTQGQPLYIVEVMKMFNKVYAPFAGTIDKVLVDGDGVIIKKGQPWKHPRKSRVACGRKLRRSWRICCKQRPPLPTGEAANHSLFHISGKG
jgi:biotin carboxyl carrier protein